MPAKKTTLTALLTIALGAAAPASLAQQGYDATQGGQGHPPPQQGAAQVPTDPATLDRFAAALTRIQAIRKDFQARLEGVEGKAEARSQQMKAQEQMVQAVQDAGLSVQDYNRLGMQMNSDPALKQKVMERVQDR